MKRRDLIQNGSNRRVACSFATEENMIGIRTPAARFPNRFRVIGRSIGNQYQTVLVIGPKRGSGLIVRALPITSFGKSVCAGFTK